MTARVAKVKRTVWKERSSLMVHERAKHWARRGGMTLEVVLFRGTIVGRNIVASLERVVQPEGRHEIVARNEWSVTPSDQRLVSAQIAVAQRWAEMESDRLAGEA